MQIKMKEFGDEGFSMLDMDAFVTDGGQHLRLEMITERCLSSWQCAETF